MTQNDDQRNDARKTEDEVSNVDLQFMGSTDEKRDLQATVKAEAATAKAATNPEKAGLETHDVVVAQTMDASDPPSSNMGDTETTDK